MIHLWCTKDNPLLLFYSVSSEANFSMSATRMTIGGFTQPGVARNIIEMPSNSEKGLSHRFVWIFPKPICDPLRENQA